MQVMKLKSVKVYADTEIFSEKELEAYVDKYSEELRPLTLTEIFIKLSDDGNVDVETVCEDKFERIRRITGYLSGDLTSWNDAKRAEESERVKHAYISQNELDKIIAGA